MFRRISSRGFGLYGLRFGRAILLSRGISTLIQEAETRALVRVPTVSAYFASTSNFAAFPPPYSGKDRARHFVSD